MGFTPSELRARTDRLFTKTIVVRKPNCSQYLGKNDCQQKAMFAIYTLEGGA